jgi:acetyl esterase/lipase
VSRLRGEHHDHHDAATSAPLKSSLVHEPTPTPPDIKTSAPQNGAPGSEHDKSTTLHPFTEHKGSEEPGQTEESLVSPHRANPGLAYEHLTDRKSAHTTGEVRQTTLTLCNAPMRLEVRDEPVLIDTQIQLYATNAQLCHPWVSPILGYLGGLPPLLVIAGDKEVLRDEIIYA